MSFIPKRALSGGVFWIIGLFIVAFFLYLIVSEPGYARQVCPALKGSNKYTYGGIDTNKYNLIPDAFGGPVDCKLILEGNLAELSRLEGSAWCQRPEKIEPKDYNAITKNCQHFKESRGYTHYPVSNEEKQFPLAFSILMYESPEQVERLLRAIYRPQNVYCIHIDSKSSRAMHKAMYAISQCFDNVILASYSVDVRWAEFSVLEAELQCMKDLWQHKVTWKYFINLTGRDFPLKTNLELVKILMAYNGANDVDGSQYRRPMKWTEYRWITENWMSGERKLPAPHGYVIHKGSAHVAVTRGFVDFVLHNKTALDLLEWMKDIRVPDEHFFQTVNHQPRFRAPGAYRGNPDMKISKTRYKIWQSPSENCEGQWVHFVCNFGAGDLRRLGEALEMFANKITLEAQPVAFGCLEQWYMNKTFNPDPKFDQQYYKSLPWVNYHI